MNPLLISLGSTLIDRILPDEAAKATAKAELMRAEQDGDLRELETRLQVMLAEAKSADPWTSRARPTFMYVFYLILLANCFVIPILGLMVEPEILVAYYANLATGLQALPTELWVLFGTAFTGYTVSRSYDKKQVLQGGASTVEKVLGRLR